MVVERKLMEQQLPSRRDMGRDAFIEKVWEWKPLSRESLRKSSPNLLANAV
ncbi:Valine--tRNA ligase [compost metagenome]